MTPTIDELHRAKATMTQAHHRGTDQHRSRVLRFYDAKPDGSVDAADARVLFSFVPPPKPVAWTFTPAAFDGFIASLKAEDLWSCCTLGGYDGGVWREPTLMGLPVRIASSVPEPGWELV